MYKLIAGLLLGAVTASVLPQITVIGDGSRSEPGASEARQGRPHVDGDQPWRGDDEWGRATDHG
jgi:hypothetical protein